MKHKNSNVFFALYHDTFTAGNYHQNNNFSFYLALVIIRWSKHDLICLFLIVFTQRQIDKIKNNEENITYSRNTNFKYCSPGPDIVLD